MDEERIERLASSLETQFNICVKQMDFYLAEVRLQSGAIAPGCYGTFLQILRANTQIAGTIARIDSVKNRNSKTQ